MEESENLKPIPDTETFSLGNEKKNENNSASPKSKTKETKIDSPIIIPNTNTNDDEMKGKKAKSKTTANSNTKFTSSSTVASNEGKAETNSDNLTASTIGPECGIGYFFRNQLLPRLGIGRYRIKKKLTKDNSSAQRLLKNLNKTFSWTSAFLSQKMVEEVKNIVIEYSFKNDFQMEADGLSAITATIWLATFLLESELRTMPESHLNDIRNLYVDLAWEAENMSLFIEENYYKLLQTLKKKCYTQFGKVEKRMRSIGSTIFEIADGNVFLDSLDGENEDDHQHICKNDRSLDRLFIDPKLALTYKINPILVPIEKRDELLLQFSEFPDAFRYNNIEELLKEATFTIKKVKDEIKENNYRRLVKEIANQNKRSGYSILRNLKKINRLMKTLFEKYELEPNTLQIIYDWVETISKDLKNYFGYADWVCDKSVEIKDMVEVSYKLTNEIYELDLPPYETIQKQIGFNYIEPGRGQKPKPKYIMITDTDESQGPEKEENNLNNQNQVNSGLDHITPEMNVEKVASKTISDKNEKVASKSKIDKEEKNISKKGSHQHLNNKMSITSTITRNTLCSKLPCRKISSSSAIFAYSHKKERGTYVWQHFFMTEYHVLLQKIPVIHNKMKFILEIEFEKTEESSPVEASNEELSKLNEKALKIYEDSKK